MVGCGKTNTLILIYRLSITLTSWTCVAFESSTNKTLKLCNFCTWNSYKTYFGALEFFVVGWQ